MVVARKRRKQTTQRVDEVPLSTEAKPDSCRLDVFVDMNQSSGGNAGRTIAEIGARERPWEKGTKQVLGRRIVGCR
jgi:hypothetical protein